MQTAIFIIILTAAGVYLARRLFLEFKSPHEAKGCAKCQPSLDKKNGDK